MNNKITLDDGLTVEIQAVTGVVINDRQWTETNVSSTPQNGYITPQGVIIGGGQRIQTQTSHYRKFWLRNAAGLENWTSLASCSLEFMTGHRVTSFAGFIPGTTDAAVLALINHNTNEKWIFSQGDRSSISNVAKKTGMDRAPKGILARLLIVMLVISIIGMPILAMYYIYANIKLQAKLKQFEEKLLDLMSSLQPKLSEELRLLDQSIKSAA